ncbi:hypothetical protein BOV90_05820 [Solemya velum gill symbiont]|uniref:Secreted protein n=1 Tax=Solemya velum gill symbiont TaxID=2340 RepID=A0A1T2CS31_SOVGS|nr:hypothetical protein [Solemya velum gill symbiont]OOY35003.1 hypothetical protein BOV88_06700 [Solemya velum gill symbiont]OOY37705.1 hypothetical protein BOV89_05610 [Solemya velum gill symbiont]OOY40094.1 hypothetical protein BOV90_05820 [Solemya velum gill symbiont]OOY44014.1 hypothetical protein BOV92_09770 [Solemya velum gill symbiont]OOY48309.1 hypothetical protein BOV93_03165 [Solemya velum gill symbiont]
MITCWRSATCVIIIFGSLVTQTQAYAYSCHLHAPDDYVSFSKQPLVIPGVGNQAECEKLNLQRFSSRGRCHCTQDTFATGREMPSDFLAPGQRKEQLP